MAWITDLWVSSAWLTCAYSETEHSAFSLKFMIGLIFCSECTDFCCTVFKHAFCTVFKHAIEWSTTVLFIWWPHQEYLVENHVDQMGLNFWQMDSDSASYGKTRSTGWLWFSNLFGPWKLAYPQWASSDEWFGSLRYGSCIFVKVLRYNPVCFAGLKISYP